LEFCVNDGGTNDLDTIRNMESLVVRLKSLSNPSVIEQLQAGTNDFVIKVAAGSGDTLWKCHYSVAER
jgi:ubiquinone/menaquinone biosynthesis C-methylase UbiE